MSKELISPRKKKTLGGAAVFYYGESMVWLTGSALSICVLMIVGFLSYILWMGMSTFWPSDLHEFVLKDKRIVAGEIYAEENYQNTQHLAGDARVELDVSAAEGAQDVQPSRRTFLRSCNFELTGTHFEWVDNDQIEERRTPAWLVFMERLTQKPFVGYPVSLAVAGSEQAQGAAATWTAVNKILPGVHERFQQRVYLAKHVLGDLRDHEADVRMEMIAVELDAGKDSAAYRDAAQHYQQVLAQVQDQTNDVLGKIKALKSENDTYQITLKTANGEKTTLPCEEIVRVYAPNQLSIIGKLQVYASRWYEFITADPRQANSQGGIWPALCGTVLMTMLMIIFVMPFGVIAALYMREYAKKGILLTTVRISINNLAGVPSIVFGVFGLGFFCYIIGDAVDNTFFPAYVHEALPVFKKGGILWAACTMALLTLPVVIVATEEALSAVPNSMREGSYGCGASKWQTIRRIVLPRALPGILTGMILAMARGAGEVAPLMLVGAVKVAAELPTHPSASFMHLGFHIFDLSFHSQDSEAAKPMVFTTTLLLITIVAVLNIMAIYLRNRLNKRFNIQTF